ncbi:Unknown protein [Striga hermonthica]|uniref:Uncharacterized protein n=1 Tax=Striga hermonthica TaxID=68872 RepID=A0A9N7NMZ5_STRHE|nr:Unknown protein [Striga hermonthica]
MRVSLEAQAMSGANYLEHGYDMEEWERMESEVPAYLLAEEDEEKKEPEKIVRKRYFLSSENSDQKQYHACENEWDEVDEAQYEGQKAKKCWGYLPLSFGMIIISTFFWLLIEKCRKINSGTVILIVYDFWVRISRKDS